MKKSTLRALQARRLQSSKASGLEKRARLEKESLLEKEHLRALQARRLQSSNVAESEFGIPNQEPPHSQTKNPRTPKLENLKT